MTPKQAQEIIKRIDKKFYLDVSYQELEELERAMKYLERRKERK